ncbi:MAG: hypothetical protein L0221_16405, partial [Chloroflexi bacterium]|nr:hypothetical protein [Chloroflexota bacterium]
MVLDSKTIAPNTSSPAADATVADPLAGDEHEQEGRTGDVEADDPGRAPVPCVGLRHGQHHRHQPAGEQRRAEP